MADAVGPAGDRAAGGTVVGGLEVLFWQATVQVELMTGQPAPIAAMRARPGRRTRRPLTFPVEPVLLVAALFAAVVGGPWLAQVAARLAARDDTARADWRRRSR